MTAQPPSRLQWRFAGVIVALAAVWLAMLLGGAGPVDRGVYEAMYAGHRPALMVIAWGFTVLGEPTLLIGGGVVIALWLWHARRPRLGVVILLVMIAGRILSEAQKYWIARVRPDIEPHLVVVKTSSFPSGHAASSMIFYLSLALVLSAHSPRRFAVAAAAIVLSLLVGASRVMLGVHWPSDVIGGWAFGLLWVLLTLRPAERLLRSDSEMEQTRL